MISPTPRSTVSAAERDRERDALPRHPGEARAAFSASPSCRHRLDPARRERDDPVGMRPRARHRARSGASCARAAAARPPRRRSGRSPDRGSPSARRGRRAARREGTRGRGRCAGARRSTAAGRPRRRPSRSRPAGARRTTSAPASSAASCTRSSEASAVAEPDVVGDRAAEQGRALRHPGDLRCASAAGSQSARSTSPTRIRPAAGLVEAAEQRREGALAAAARPDERDGLARRELERRRRRAPAAGRPG